MSRISPLAPPLPKQSDNKISWQNLQGCGASLAIAELAKRYSHPLLMVTANVQQVITIAQELQFFNHSNALPVTLFPDWETLPYDHFSPHQDLVSQRLQTLFQMQHLSQGIIVAAASTLMHRILPKTYINAHTLLLHQHDKIHLNKFRERLTHAGYQHVDQVIAHGEYALRGSILDIFPMGSTLPYRIEFFDEAIESIRSFDPDTQRSLEKTDAIRFLPAREYPLTNESITHFRQQWRAKFAGNPQESVLYQNISQGQPASGIEYYLPLFFETTQTFFDYLPKETLIIYDESLTQNATLFMDEVQHRYEQLRYDQTRPLLPPNEIFINVEQFYAALKSHTKIILSKTNGIAFDTQPSPELTVHARAKQPLELLNQYISHTDTRILFCAESTGRREVLLELLNEIHCRPPTFPTWESFLQSEARLGITVAALARGTVLTSPNIALICEAELFGEQVQQRRYRTQRTQDPEAMIRNLTELHIGDPVVHIQHGVGRYLGLQTINTGEIETEFLALEYAGGDKIYVPVTSLHVINRYTGVDAEHAPLQKLGTSQWSKAKEKAQKRAHDVAVELLEIYSRREATPGYAFKSPDKDYQLFQSAFPFETTPDQQKAIDDVIRDMISPHSMDRLICGDVGFGKTEVAMRAAFLAIQSHKQVAILVPTTLLASQHYQTFQDRFADWPVKIGILSRMRTPKEQEETIAAIYTGKVDIIIATHKLLSESIKFKDLGLLIVDEEHRFGVRQKEKIKSLRAHVDILTLTATPIPRTLNMAMVGTRDLSIIATPPEKRLSVKTFVHLDSESIIREAILRETMRGGQLYFLHNDVVTINGMAERLQKIAPQTRIGVAHGQMRERELERVMSEFYHQKYNVLVCTTIIESGIDIPTANTIIINRADRFGLAQLHQIRGRVGRSHHQAYAYLLIPDEKIITKDAEKRLEAITKLEDLGVGFALATHDLEIRGAGELLGDEQSGHIHAIGFSLYMELIEEAVKALKSGKTPSQKISLSLPLDIDLHISALIPHQYVTDVHTRLILYKRLANCKNKDSIHSLKAEVIDRFGMLPPEAITLFEQAQLKLKAQALGIQKIDVGSQFGYLDFCENPNIDPIKIIQLVQKHPQQYQLQGPQRLRFAVKQPITPEAKLNQLAQLLQLLSS